MWNINLYKDSSIFRLFTKTESPCTYSIIYRNKRVPTWKAITDSITLFPTGSVTRVYPKIERICCGSITQPSYPFICYNTTSQPGVPDSNKKNPNNMYIMI